MIKESYTPNEVMYIMEVLGAMYEYDYTSGLWNMQTHMAPGMIHEGTKALLDRMEYGFQFSVDLYAKERDKKPLRYQPIEITEK